MTLTRVYTLLHEYQTLVREIATPTIPSFATACLQLIKPPAPGRTLKAPMSLVETVLSALSTVVPLYPTTLRPFSTQIRGAVRLYLAPTWSDASVVPDSLRASARRLVVLLPFTAPKNGSAEEWAKTIDAFLKDTHQTADQIFRAIQESWEPTAGFAQGNVSYDGEPHGGGDAADELPPWTGLQSGAQRLIGLLDLVSECLRCPTKSQVTVPLGAISDLISRLTSILPPPPSSSQTSQSSMQLNPNIGREEREELWSLLPDVHIATMKLCLTLVRRQQRNVIPLAAEMLDQAIQVLGPSHHIPQVREGSYALVRELLLLQGPSLARMTVGSLEPAVRACCTDLLGAAGHPGDQQTQDISIQNGVKSKVSSANADLFLPRQGSASRQATLQLAPGHVRAAEDLLEVLLSHLPRQLVRKAERALMDRTAILSGSRRAMLARVLNPYVDKSGKYFANTIPFLAQAFPDDPSVEILRSSLRTQVHHSGDVFAGEATRNETDELETDAIMSPVIPSIRVWPASEEGERLEERDTWSEEGFTTGFGSIDDDAAKGSHQPFVTSSVVQTRAVESSAKPAAETIAALKRKSEETIANAPKRVDTGKAPAVPPIPSQPMELEDGSGSESEESVRLQMVFDEDEDSDDME